MEYKAFPFESVKSEIDLEKRTIALHSSVTMNVDLGDDIILPGAFEKTLREKREDSKGTWRIPLLWQHDSDVPIGKPLELYEDNTGLYSVDEIPDTGPGCPGTRALILAKSGVVWGCSIGYSPHGAVFNEETGIRTIPEIELFERSIVTFPMNESARILGVGDSKRRCLQLLTPELQSKIGRVLRGSSLSKLEEAIGLLLAILETASVETEDSSEKQIKAVVPFESYSLDETGDWDGPSEIAAASVEDLRVMSTWYDSENPDIKAAYKLPHHRADGYATVWSGVYSAMGALLGARGGVDIPESDRQGVYTHLYRHYEEFEKEVPEFRSLEQIESEKQIGYSADEVKALQESVDSWIERFHV